MTKFVVIFFSLIYVSACSSVRYIPVDRCQPLSPKTLITVQDYILRTVELETYLDECTRKER